MRPVLANYYVTNRCNASCDFCNIWEDTKSPFIQLEEVKKNLEDLKKLGVKIIDFTGGEPLLHKNIDQLLRLAKSMGFRTTLTSNGLLYPKKAESIKGLVDLLHFSLDSAYEEKHDLHRGVKCFQSVMESLKLAKSLGEKPDILFTVRNDNYLELPEIYKISSSLGLILILNPLFSYGDKGDVLKSDVLDYMEEFAKKPLTYLNPSFVMLRRNGGNQINDPVCKAVSSTVVISARNELLLPCYHMTNKSIPIENNLFELRNSDAVKEAEKMQGKYDFCQGCTINCYFEPSFAVSLNAYMLKSIPSKIKYGYNKFVKPKFNKQKA